jgi:hypothetical protein
MLTRKRTEGSRKSIIDMVELTSKNSGQKVQGGIGQFAQQRAPLESQFLSDDLWDELLLPSHSMGSGLVGIYSAVMNSGDVCR